VGLSELRLCRHMKGHIAMDQVSGLGTCFMMEALRLVLVHTQTVPGFAAVEAIVHLLRLHPLDGRSSGTKSGQIDSCKSPCKIVKSFYYDIMEQNRGRTLFLRAGMPRTCAMFV